MNLNQSPMIPYNYANALLKTNCTQMVWQKRFGRARGVYVYTWMLACEDKCTGHCSVAVHTQIHTLQG